MPQSFLGDQLVRTATLPVYTKFTACGFARRTTDSGVYATLFSLENAGFTQYLVFQTDSNGDDLLVFDFAGASAIVKTITDNRDFFWAITCDGAIVKIYYMTLGNKALTRVNKTYAASAIVSANMRIGSSSAGEDWQGDIGGIKIWDAVLTDQELYIESQSILPYRKRDIHIVSPLDQTDEVRDLSGNNRPWTNAGTLPFARPFPVPRYPRYPAKRRVLKAASGGVSGSLAVTLANDTLAASGTTTVKGSLAKTLGDDTLAAQGTTTVVGALAKTLGNDTLAAQGTTTVKGSTAVTLGDDTLVASGSVGSAVDGALAVTLGNDTLAAVGTTTVKGALAVTLASDTLAAAGTTTLVGVLAVTLSGAALAAQGTTTIKGTLAQTLGNDTLAAQGTAGTPPAAPTATATAMGIYIGIRIAITLGVMHGLIFRN